MLNVDDSVRQRMAEHRERVEREEREWREARLHERLYGVVIHPTECDDCQDGTHRAE